LLLPRDTPLTQRLTDPVASIKQLALEAGFELAGVTAAEPTLESLFYPKWIAQGYHGKMGYLEGRRGEMRSDPRTLLPSARSVISVGKVYNTEHRYTTEFDSDSAGWISRYAWGEDYHDILKSGLDGLVEKISEKVGDADFKVCVDTSPILERAYAHGAGLGWIGKNTCLINEQIGSWVFLGEILTSLDLAPDDPAPFRCGTCTRCIEACPTDAFVEVDNESGPSHALDATRCISYWTIELRGEIPEPDRESIGQHLFGCDICQDVCPWNRPERAASTADPGYQPEHAEPDLEELAGLTEQQFNERFENSAIKRSRYQGFLRNIAVVMGNSGNQRFMPILARLANWPDEIVKSHAKWALERLRTAARDDSD
jgi:epoxyqueuosine reductase